MTTTTTNLPETILALADFSVIRVIFDPDDACDYDYAVIDADGDEVDQSDDREAAIEAARYLQAELDAERADERRSDLRDAIGEALDGCEDEARLRMILAILKR